MKYLTTFLFLLIVTSLSAQCVSHSSKKGNSCGNPNSMDIKIENNCSSKVYVVALCYDENRQVKKLLANHVEGGKNMSNYTCECSNVQVKYWNFDDSDQWAAFRSGQAWYKECKDNNQIR